jgi:hypothetical protein
MKRPGRIATIVALVLALGALAAFALLSGGSRPAQAAVRHATKHATHRAAHHARHTRHHAARTAADPAATSDADNVQSGDQTSPDNPPAATTGEGESNTESEQGQPGEPANGHQDTGSNANNECTGDCVQ